MRGVGGKNASADLERVIRERLQAEAAGKKLAWDEFANGESIWAQKWKPLPEFDPKLKKK
jgi:hypothetical protein